MQRFSVLTRILIAIGVCLIFTGCGDKSGRQNLSGAVTFGGEPIPFGKISFRPDRERGGKGPAGFANIVEGKYSTKASGKGAVAGPVQVIIEGLKSDRPMATPLFPPYKTTSDVGADIKQLDFEVPLEAATDAFKKKQQVAPER